MEKWLWYSVPECVSVYSCVYVSLHVFQAQIHLELAKMKKRSRVAYPRCHRARGGVTLDRRANTETSHTNMGSFIHVYC